MRIGLWFNACIVQELEKRSLRKGRAVRGATTAYLVIVYSRRVPVYNLMIRSRDSGVQYCSPGIRSKSSRRGTPLLQERHCTCLCIYRRRRRPAAINKHNGFIVPIWIDSFD